MASNFDFLADYWPDMAQIGKVAEMYLPVDPWQCAQMLELLTQRAVLRICGFENLRSSELASCADGLRALKYADLLPQRVGDLCHVLYKATANAQNAPSLLALGCSLCGWMVKVYADPAFPLKPWQPIIADTDLQVQSDKLRELLGETTFTEAPLKLSGAQRRPLAEEAADGLPLTAEQLELLSREPVRIDAQILPAINYALHHNGVAAIREITIENKSDRDYEDVQLHITSVPEFALPLDIHIHRLPGGKTVTVSRPKLLLNADFLGNVTEKVVGTLGLELRQGEQTVASDFVQTKVFAFNEWHGLGLYPELLASFVTPNHPRLSAIISAATAYLGRWTGDTSMDGYQSQDPNRVLSQAAAIFTAIKDLGIAYIVPPASFERQGQRVRLCDTVLQQKLGTCLDLTLLYASCLEAVGLHPLLICVPGHIFTGVWLEDKMFPECVQDDGAVITKRLAAGVNEIAVVETTCVTTGEDRSFDDARAAGERNLNRNNTESIIDLRRCRMSNILPLPQRVQTEGGWVLRSQPTVQKETAQAPRKLEQTIRTGAAQEVSLPKKAQWERKLLDLGMRNTLINLRLTKTQLPILTGSLDELENALADGSDFTVLPRPSDLRMEEFSFDALGELGASGIVQAEFANKRLRSVLTEAELTKVIKELYRSAKTALEENGANTLYLALGMLKWYESKRSTKARYAPVILVPIEMVRKSAAQGYVIRLRDDEPQMNITLLEKLKQDFGIVVNGLDPLPMDAHGIDIRRVLTVMRQAVMEQAQWDVVETASIGIFSFSQFVMWNDIRNRAEDLMRNKVVRSLMENKLCWDAQPLEIGLRVNENDVLLPMPADASQLYAIETACAGESFVLHGPPGTGKSQTITSLIANALAQGKRVLFVAEKMAALEVVQRRLEGIGIGPFCLELHSNKSKKRDVLEQLRRASEVTKTQSAREYAAKAKQLAAMRSELDGYAGKLHRPLPCGRDLYTLINEYEHCKQAPEQEDFARTFVKNLTAQDLERQLLVVEQLVAAGKEAGHPSNHPLKPVGCTQYTQTLRGELDKTVNAYLSCAQGLAPHAQRLAKATGQEQPDSFEALKRLSALASDLACWYDMPAPWAKVSAPQLYFEEVERMTGHFLKANALEQRLLAVFEPGFLSLNGAELFAQWTEVSSKWFLPKMLGTNKLVKTAGSYAKAPVGKEQLGSYITALRDLQQETAAAGTLLSQYGQDLGGFYQGKETDWEGLCKLAQQAKASARSLYAQKGNYDLLHLCGADPELKEAVQGLVGSFDDFTNAKAAFDDLLKVRQLSGAYWLYGQCDLCQAVLDHASELKSWIAYQAAAEEAVSLGLSNVVTGYEKGAAHESVSGSYQKAMLKALICDAIDDSGTLNSFSGAVFNKKIEQYKRMDQQWTQLSQQEIYCRLAANVPDFTREAANSSELGILQRCIKSGGRGTSIRKLFDQIPNLLFRLCPCMLMSPISAAQYLDPKRELFDLVVFDEASQLPTCKAVGVLARGRDAVIVGDPKQMPPTSFFAANTVDEDNLEAEDLESILDDCLALNMPQSYLLWHYRSRHESLIAFSNSRFYENKLFTFPSVNDRESKVRLIHVDGVFERGKGRVNKAEAQAVVEEIRRRSKDPLLSKQSLGVVTFNISQQHLIDDLLNEACARDPELEQWAFASEEPVFIKNLENVQGDERDVILFSIGFGPDEKGKVYMNFGPLNREGGWRRLNVAVSRARCEMTVFSTLRPEQLDLNRTAAEGVAALRGFLEYAEGRTLALEEASSVQTKKPDGIAAAICEALAAEGYDADLSVGRSEYRIDIGVVDPEQPDRYLLGIMLDGDGYGAAKTTRDREIAQIGVLNGLGWNIHRVWTMDWWDNSEKELSQIVKLLKQLRKGEKKPEAQPVPVVTEQLAKAAPKAVAEPPVYQGAKLPVTPMSPEDFVEPENKRELQKRIREVINAEAPVSLPVLTRRVVQSYGITRAGSRIQAHFSAILEKEKTVTTQQEDTVFFWKKNQVPQHYRGFRVSGEGDNRRDAKEVALQEVANAVYNVLLEQISMAQEDLLRETAKKLGYTRLGGNVLSALELGIDYAREQGGIQLGTNGAYILTEQGTAYARETLMTFSK